MAEVTSGFHSLSSKKSPSFSNSGFTISSSSSSSSKHIYDDVFACPPSRKFKSSEFSSFGDDYYAEIFGSSKSENGVWRSTSSSIPIFNLPDSEHRRGNRGRVDYLGVFGGGGDDNLDLPDGEELFDQMKKAAKTLGSASIPRSKDHTKEATTSHISRHSENGERRTRGFSQSFDSVEHFEHQIEMAPYEANGATHVVHVHANPRPPHEVGPSQKTQTNRTPIIMKETEVRMGAYPEKEGKHSRNTSSQLGVNEQKREHDAGFQMASRLSQLNSTARSYETHQNTVNAPSKQVKEGSKVQFNVNDDAGIVIPRSTSLHEGGALQKTQTNRTPTTKGSVELDIDIGLANKKAEPSRNTCLELKKGELSRSTDLEQGANEWKYDHDDSSRRASGLSDSNPTASLHDTCRINTIAGPSKMVKDDIKVEFDVQHDPIQLEPSNLVASKQNGQHDATSQKESGRNWSDQNVTSQDTFEVSSVAESSKEVRVDAMTAVGPDLGKKQGRHARMASLDLGDRKQASQADAESQRNARFGSSYSFDASHDPFAARIKVQPSKVVPSSSLPQFFPVENHCKVSENSSCKNSENHMYRGSGGSPPALDEQLDVNSVAAISAAALQRAIEEAEMRIRLAKEFLEREGQGSGKMSFKDALKRKVGKENDNVDEIYECQQNNAQHQPQVESRMQTCHHSERKTVLEADHVAPDSGGLKKSSKDEGPMEAKSAEMSKSIEEGDKHEGGEWEAAKHLNQLISGVKNRIASFMAWQAEPEKKEESKETEASRKSQPLSQGEQELKDAEVFEMKETDIKEYVSASACETKYGESKTGFIPETIELAENELMQSNSVVQEKAVPKLDVVPDNEGPIRTNFLFFSFTGRRSWDCTPLEEGEDRKTSGTGELGVENRKEETIEMKDEQIQGKSEEANLERLGDSCVSRHCGKSLQGSSNGEKLCSVSEYDRTKLTCEEERLNEEHGIDRRLNDECRDDRSECTHEDDHDSSLAEECDDDRSELTYQENRKMSEEFGADRNDFTYQENERLNDQCGDNGSDCNHENDRSMKEECRDDRSMKEECRDDRSELTHSENRRPSEECGGNCSEFTHKEDIRLRGELSCRDNRSELTHPENRRPSEECGGNCSEFTHKEDIRLRGEHGVNRSNLTCEEGNDCRPSEKCGGDFPCERINDATVYEEYGEEPISSNHCPEAVIMPIVTDDEREEYEEFENAENQLDDIELLEEADLMDKIEKRAEAIEEVNGRQENERDQGLVDDIEEVSQLMNGWEEDKRNQSQVNHAEETETRLADLVGCILANDECEQAEHGFPSDDEEPSGVVGSNSEVEEAVTSDEENEKMMEINNSSSESEMDSDVTVFPNESEMLVEEPKPSSEPKKDVENSVATQEAGDAMGEERVLASFLTENTLESLGVVRFDGADGALPCENFGLHERETDLNCRQTDLRGEVLESESEEICENQTELLNESAETVDVGEAPHVSDHVGETCSFEAVHRRRRWFENNEKVSNAGRPGILEVEGDGTTLETDQEVLEESDLAGSVEIHADKLENEALEVTIGTETSNALNQEDNRVNVEATHRRRRWFVDRGEGIPELPSLFGGIKLTPEMDPAIVNKPHPRVQSEGFVDHIRAESEDPLNVVEAEVVVNEEKSKQSVEATPRRKRWFENGDKLGPNQQQRRNEDARTTTDINQEYKETGNSEKSEEGRDDMHNKTEPSDEVHRDLDAVNRRKKEKEKERIVVERAIREARERAFAEARERARRDAVERPREGSLRAGSVGPDKPGRAPSENITAADKASMEAKLKAERAAVERATAEARERALQKALSEKASHRLREPAGRHQPERASSFDPKFHSSSSYMKCSDPSSKGEKHDGADDESAQRRKARLERQKRTVERAAKALEEKNKRDLQAQKEQAARNMLADPLDAEVKRWSSGKEGNLRALLSTLQYILGSDSGWQAISLTDLVAPTAVRKAYKKATLCVHPDKLQQRGATIQQKYICEKVFDLLKEAWSKFSPDER